MTVMVCIWLTSRRIVAENVRVLSLFGTLPGYQCDRGCAQCGGIGARHRRIPLRQTLMVRAAQATSRSVILMSRAHPKRHPEVRALARLEGCAGRDRGRLLRGSLQPHAKAAADGSLAPQGDGRE
jgi:hypothetical protein